MDLTDAYENAGYIPDAAGFVARWPVQAEAFRTTLGTRFEPGFDLQTRRGVDLALPKGTPKGLVVFVHGGYWRRFAPGDWSHLAAGALAHGWAFALPGYPLCPDVRISEITQVVTEGICDVAGRIEGPIALVGHSAGGHLVARMAETLPPAVRTRVLRIAPISMLCDLAPLMQTDINADLAIDAEEARAESPLGAPAPDGIDVRLWVGGDERPAFLDQTRWLSTHWGAPQTIVAGRHHFDVIEALEDPDSEMVRWLCTG